METAEHTSASSTPESSTNQHPQHEAEKAAKKKTEKKTEPTEPITARLQKLALNVYDVHYKKLLILPAALIIFAFGVLLYSFFTTGQLFERDVSLKGGVSVTAITSFSDVEGLSSVLQTAFPGAEFNIRRLTEAGRQVGVVVDSSVAGEDSLDKMLDLLSSQLSVSKDELTVQSVGASLGASFFRMLTRGLVIAFVFMALTVFIYLKIVSGKWIWLPSLFVIWTAFVDMICVLAVLNLLGVRLSAAGMAAFLMLIGYSVDTDILLTIRALKSREDTVFQRITGALKTGVFMTLTGMTAVVVGYFFSQSETIKQIMLVLSLGLAFDLVHTWITNAGMLRWYLQKAGMA